MCAEERICYPERMNTRTLLIDFRRFRGPMLVPFALSVLLLLAHIVALFTAGFGGRINRLQDFALVVGSVVFLMIASALRIGADVWDRRLLPWGAKSRP